MIKKILTSRWLYSFLGLLAICLIVWFILPVISINESEIFAAESTRWWIISALLFMWFLFFAYRWIKERKNNNAMINELLMPDESNEVNQLEDKLLEALESLKRRSIGKGSRSSLMFQKPWYIIIGPPGSGKTTALINSGLEFPLNEDLDKLSFSGAGGTRNCDWWITEDAVLIDTAGRYTTQDSDTVEDSKAWMGFLDLLKKYRKKQPVNGVIFALSIDQMISNSDEEITQNINIVRQRLRELNDAFQLKLPLYIILTKLDLIAGFKEYFGNLNIKDRKQVWGFSFEYNQQLSALDNAKKIEAELQVLVKSLLSQLTDRLDSERNPEYANLIYRFPVQINSIARDITTFISGIFTDNPHTENINLRGVYLTSGTQEGTPLDRLLTNMSSGFSAASAHSFAQQGKGKSYFIHDILKKIIFPEAGIVGINKRFKNIMLWSRLGFNSLAILLTIFFNLAWFGVYEENKTYVTGVIKNVDEVELRLVRKRGKHDISDVLALIGQVSSLSDDKSGQVFFADFGIDQHDKLEDATEELLTTLTTDYMLPLLKQIMEDDLKHERENIDLLYEVLKTYVMLEQTEHYDDDYFFDFLTSYLPYKSSEPVTSQALQAVFTVIKQNRRDIFPLKNDKNAIQSARNQLNRQPFDQIIYFRLKREMMSVDSTPYKLQDVVNKSFLELLANKSKGLEIPYFFTHEGYKQQYKKLGKDFVKQYAGEKWVLGDTVSRRFGQPEVVKKKVDNHYFNEYAQHWQKLAKAIRFNRQSKLANQVDTLSILLDKEGALFTLLLSIQENTQLTPQLAQKVLSKTSRFQKRLEGVFGKDKPDLSQKLAGNETPVDEKFKQLHRLMKEQDGQYLILEENLQPLLELQSYLFQLDSSPDPAEIAFQEMADRAGSAKLLAQIKLKAQSFPAPLSNFFQAFAEDAKILLTQLANRFVAQAWKQDVLPFCQAAIQNRYPLAKGASSTISMTDFAEYFGPGGRVDSFYQKYLTSFVDKRGGKWRLKRNNETTISISSKALKNLQRSDRIRRSFFKKDAAAVNLQFTLKPINMAANINKLVLEIDQQQVVYRHGPTRAKSLVWPDSSGSQWVNLSMMPPLDVGQSSISFEGDWSLYRLFDHFGLRKTKRPENYQIHFTLGDRTARYSLSASSVYNPFNLEMLRSYRCLQGL